jgi:hypothetical protein
LTSTNNLDLIGQQSALVAVANHPNSTTLVVTSSSTWQSSNSAVVSVNSAGVATAVSVGSAVITAAYQGASGTISMLVGSQPICSNYDPSALQVQDILGDQGLSLTLPFQGNTFELLEIFDTAADGANGLALYQRYTTVCYIGKYNARPSHSAYVSEYWTNPSGRSTTIQPEDCDSYSPSTLQIVNTGATGWSLMASGRQLLLLDVAADATTMSSIAAQYSNQCFIGRQNTRPTPADYIFRYWK